MSNSSKSTTSFDDNNVYDALSLAFISKASNNDQEFGNESLSIAMFSNEDQFDTSISIETSSSNSTIFNNDEFA